MTRGKDTTTTVLEGDHGSSKPTCQVCLKYGHDALRWRNHFNDAYHPEDPPHTDNSTNTSSYLVDPNWYVDSDAYDHLTNDLDHLNIHERYNRKDHIQVANGAGLNISHIGHSMILGFDKPLYLRNILHVPSISKNLLLVHILASDNNAFIELHCKFLYVKDQVTRRALLRGKSCNGLYLLPPSFLQSCSLSSPS
jgi:hypothetical protein